MAALTATRPQNAPRGREHDSRPKTARRATPSRARRSRAPRAGPRPPASGRWRRHPRPSRNRPRRSGQSRVRELLSGRGTPQTGGPCRSRGRPHAGRRAEDDASGHPSGCPDPRRRRRKHPPACARRVTAGRQVAETLLHCTRHNDRGLGPASGLPLNTRPIRGIGGNPTVPVCAVVVANGPGDHSGREPDSGGWSRPLAAPAPSAPRRTNRPAIDGRRRTRRPRTLNRNLNRPDASGPSYRFPGVSGNPRALRGAAPTLLN